MSSDKLNYYAQLLSDKLDDCIGKCNEPYKNLIQAMQYSLSAGGKHLRGAILLESAACCGGNLQKALPFALAIEMIHTYSLIHDDLPEMDNSDFRRKKPACHIKFGHDIALLAGDGLLSYAVEYMCTNSQLEPKITLDIIGMMLSASGSNGMLAGQTLDKLGEKSQLDFDQLLKLQQLKTGKLFESACLAGCMAFNASDKHMQAFKEYSRHIGLAFQIKDDFLDMDSSAEQLGKPVLNDTDKNTFVKLLGREKAQKLLLDEAALAKEAVSCLEKTDFFIWLADFIVNRKN